MTATYGGGAGHHPSAGEVVHRVTKLATVTTLGASPDPAMVGD